MVKHKEISLKKHSIIEERHIQSIIVANPKILGLGDDLKGSKEINQKNAGRLDLLFQDNNLNKKYEVEIQLGQLDESHLLRTIGYWNIERKKSPDFDHTAVVIAENIRPKILDLIELLKGIVSVIVLEMTAFEKENGIICLKFERIDLNKRIGREDDNDNVIKEKYESFEELDIYFRENKASETAKEIVNKIYYLLQKIDPNMKIYCTKKYIGFRKEYEDQFVFVEPRCTPEEKSMSKQSNEIETKIKVHKESDSFVFIEVQKDVLLKLVLEQSSKTETKIKKAGLFPNYDPRKGKKCGQYIIRINKDDLKNKELDLKELLKTTYDHNMKN